MLVLLIGRCASQLEKPRIFSVPGHFGAPTFMLTPPKPVSLVKAGFSASGPVWLGGTTVVHQGQPKAWTRADTLRLERQNAERRAQLAARVKSKKA